jgi:hypothetical protein
MAEDRGWGSNPNGCHIAEQGTHVNFFLFIGHEMMMNT